MVSVLWSLYDIGGCVNNSCRKKATLPLSLRYYCLQRKVTHPPWLSLCFSGSRLLGSASRGRWRERAKLEARLPFASSLPPASMSVTMPTPWGVVHFMQLH